MEKCRDRDARARPILPRGRRSCLAVCLSAAVRGRSSGRPPASLHKDWRWRAVHGGPDSQCAIFGRPPLMAKTNSLARPLTIAVEGKCEFHSVNVLWDLLWK